MNIFKNFNYELILTPNMNARERLEREAPQELLHHGGFRLGISGNRGHPRGMESMVGEINSGGG